MGTILEVEWLGGCKWIWLIGNWMKHPLLSTQIERLHPGYLYLQLGKHKIFTIGQTQKRAEHHSSKMLSNLRLTFNEANSLTTNLTRGALLRTILSSQVKRPEGRPARIWDGGEC